MFINPNFPIQMATLVYSFPLLNDTAQISLAVKDLTLLIYFHFREDGSQTDKVVMFRPVDHGFELS